MGMNIRGYSNIRPNGTEEDGIRIKLNGFPEVEGTLQDGYYRSDDKVVSFRVGSWTGYDEFRQNLVKMIGFENIEDVLNRDSGAFWELISFTNTDGVMDDGVCGKLFEDFLIYEPIAKKELNEYDLVKYMNFKDVFEKGRHAGCMTYS